MKTETALVNLFLMVRKLLRCIKLTVEFVGENETEDVTLFTLFTLTFCGKKLGRWIMPELAITEIKPHYLASHTFLSGPAELAS